MTDFKWGKFNTTAKRYIAESDAFLNIAVGSIRSGKTITCLLRFLMFIDESPHTSFAIAGKTITSLRRNVIEPLCEMLESFGIDYEYHYQKQEINFLDNSIALFGIDKEGSDARIQGYTCAGALIDEATVMNQAGFQMLLSRCSLSDAKIFVTCNPGSPQNFVYTDYVGNKELIESGRVKVWNFLIEDNENLTEEYIQNIKSMYSKGSVFYKRHILNQWVSGQGAIFDSFTDDNILRGDIYLKDYLYFGIGSDYGTSTTTCYSLVGIKQNAEGIREYHVLDERYYNREEKGVSQTDSERVQDIIKLQEDYKLQKDTTFYVSHDAGSLKAELEKNADVRLSVETFMPDTLDCINRMSSLFHTNQLKIHESCKETIKQVQGYEWD